MLKVNSKYRLSDLIGTTYEITLKGQKCYVYRIRFHKQIVGRSYIYFNNAGDCIDRMRSDMEQIFDSGRLK